MKRILVFFLCLNCHNIVFAQSPIDNRVLPPSPTAASLGKYGDYPVSLYTGQVNIDLPIYQVQSGKLTLPISLSYNASGNKPSDIPGWVGLGWSLNAGGVITRIVQDLPDDGNGIVTGIGYYYGGAELKNQYDKIAGPDDNYRVDHAQRRVDIKPDLFMFNFNGITGKFSFDHTGHIQFYNREKFMIEVSRPNAVGYFESFTITTTDGVKYTFGQQEWGRSDIGVSGEEAAYVSSWYLTNIANTTGDIIQLNYSYDINTIRVKESSSERTINGIVSNFPFNTEVIENGISKNSSIDDVVYLDEILFTNGKLNFSKSSRHDVVYKPTLYSNYGDERKLDQIVLTDELNDVRKSWKLNYIDINSQRLKLMSVIEKSESNEEKSLAVFEYNPLQLPYYTAGANVNHFDNNDIDYWGYYNMANNTQGRIPITAIPGQNTTRGTAIRMPNEVAMKAEILQKIIYPTGGSTLFEYEPHDYSLIALGYFDNYEYVWGNPISFHYESGQFEEDPDNICFTITERSLVEMQSNCQAIYGPNSAWCNFNQQKSFIELNPGTYCLKDIFYTDVLKSSASSDIDIAGGYVKIRSRVFVSKRMAGGLRIKSVTHSNGQNTYSRHYSYVSDANPSVSTGVLSKFPANYVSLANVWYNVTGTWLSSESIEPMPDGPHIGYYTVTETLENGSKIKHYYNTCANYPDFEGTGYSGLDNKMVSLISQNYWRGLETKTEYISSNDVKIKEIVNSYLEDQNTKFDIPVLEDKYGFSLSVEPGMGSAVTLPSKYAIWCRFIYKSTTIETNYDQNGQNPVVSTTNFTYGNPSHLQITASSTTTSTGVTNQQQFLYPNEMVTTGRDPNGIYHGMISKNIISPVIEQLSNRNSAITLRRTNYFQPFTGVYVPRTIEERDVITGLDEIRVHYDEYDNKGNILSFSQENGLKTSYLWSYNRQYPVAEIKNSDYATIKNILGASYIDTFSGSNPDKTAVDNVIASLKTALPNTFITGFVYKPLVGVMSTTDPKGLTSYYEYDAFQRLKYIKDQHGNVVKSYDYHYKP